MRITQDKGFGMVVDFKKPELKPEKTSYLRKNEKDTNFKMFLVKKLIRNLQVMPINIKKIHKQRIKKMKR